MGIPAPVIRRKRSSSVTRSKRFQLASEQDSNHGKGSTHFSTNNDPLGSPSSSWRRNRRKAIDREEAHQSRADQRTHHPRTERKHTPKRLHHPCHNCHKHRIRSSLARTTARQQSWNSSHEQTEEEQNRPCVHDSADHDEGEERRSPNGTHASREHHESLPSSARNESSSRKGE
jgi:hypothetical protein